MDSGKQQPPQPLDPIQEFAAQSRLSRIETAWSMVQQAHGEDDALTLTAQQRLLSLYAGAIRRYLVAALRDPALAEDVFQDFAVKFLQGDFRHADPSKGRFRAFVKTVLFRMVAQHHRQRTSRREQSFVDDDAAPSTDGESIATDRQYTASWRDELLAQAWSKLKRYEQESGSQLWTTLTLRVEDPTASGEQFAEALSARLNKELSLVSARVTLHRARERFAKFLVEAVAESLESPSAEALEAELIDLELITYCRPALEQW